MTLQFVRAANLILASIIIASGHFYCLWYVAFMHLSLEILNRQPIYLVHSYKLYNSIFWAYELVLAERLFQHHVSETFVWLLNCGEHLGFAITICLKVYIYTAVFLNATLLSRHQRALVALILFNLIGILNEVFQNILCHRTLFIFIIDSIKDVQMNLLGSVIFFLLIFIRTKRLQQPIAV